MDGIDHGEWCEFIIWMIHHTVVRRPTCQNRVIFVVGPIHIIPPRWNQWLLHVIGGQWCEIQNHLDGVNNVSSPTSSLYTMHVFTSDPHHTSKTLKKR